MGSTESCLSAGVPEILEQLTEELREATERVLPHFLERMPAEYFRGTDYATLLSHVKAMIATDASGLSQQLILRSEDGARVTFVNERSYPGQLAELVAELPGERPLRSARVHTALDGRLVLDVFEFGQPVPFDPGDRAQAARAARILAYARQHEPATPPDELEAHFAVCAAEYVLSVPEARICQHFRLFRSMQGTEDTVVEVGAVPGRSLSNLIVGVGNGDPRSMFKRIAYLLGRWRVDIQTAHLDHFEAQGPKGTLFLSFIVAGPDGGAIDPESPFWQRIRHDLRRAKWLDEAALRLAERLPSGDLTRAEILHGLGHLVHQVLTRRNPFAFSRHQIREILERHVEAASGVADLLLERFDPDGPLGDTDFAARCVAARRAIDEVADSDEDHVVLSSLVETVEATLCTNVYVPSRYALSLAIEPRFLRRPEHEEDPYGVVYVHGRDLDGFHVRFRDIARGGVRIVAPRSREQFIRESGRLYDEAYGLASAQQLKNKDIPEGGSKGVLLAAPGSRLELCGRAFASGLLDLANPAPEIRRAIVDRRERCDPLYLGPDENVADELIAWIVAHARRRGYPAPEAFMSSKPGAGISHRAYGVTSEGVTVFLEVALRALGIDPRETPFSVKLTGGPDGDVAGNEIRILHRDYGERARIVGIADATGCAEDPEGLDHQELLRLVAAELPICHFAPERLSPRGRLHGIDSSDGVRLRNSLHNRVVADAFIPAGGRPRTLNESNWSEFIAPDGMPSSRVIVEGANLFLTPEARSELSLRGVLIVKDSSANKCGVICSSFEILASMLLSEEEFLVTKERFVSEVIGRLRELARLEAELLIHEHLRKPDISLPELSTQLSRTLTAATDAVAGSLAALEGEDAALAHQLMLEHLPPVLREAAAHRIAERVPPGYVQRTVATALAGTIVYREGLFYLDGMAREELAALALRYLRQEQETARLAGQVAASDLPDRQRIVALLRAGGTSTALRLR